MPQQQGEAKSLTDEGSRDLARLANNVGQEKRIMNGVARELIAMKTKTEL
jgi:hypothetical protein